MDQNTILITLIGTILVLIALYLAIRLTVKPQSKLKEKQTNQKLVLKMLKMFYVMDNLSAIEELKTEESKE
jgi:integral membrane sensor domain MASE1